MTAGQWAGVLAWCAGIGYAVLLAWVFAWRGMADAIYRLHSRWFRVERGTYETVVFALVGAFKLALFVLFVLPLIALYASGAVAASP